MFCFTEIPIFHILNAKITFGNIFSSDTAVNKVSLISEEVPKVLENGETVLEPVVVGCAVDDTAFDVPSEYRLRGNSSLYTKRRQLGVYCLSF